MFCEIAFLQSAPPYSFLSLFPHSHCLLKPTDLPELRFPKLRDLPKTENKVVQSQPKNHHCCPCWGLYCRRTYLFIVLIDLTLAYFFNNQGCILFEKSKLFPDIWKNFTPYQFQIPGSIVPSNYSQMLGCISLLSQWKLPHYYNFFDMSQSIYLKKNEMGQFSARFLLSTRKPIHARRTTR